MTVDAAIFADRAAFGFDLVARDFEETLIQAELKLHHGVISPQTTKVMAIKEELSWVDIMN